LDARHRTVRVSARHAAIAACWLGLVAMTTAGHAAEIALLSSTAMREPLEALVPAFEQSSGHKVAMRFESSGVLPDMVRGGARADLVVTTPPLIEALAKDGKLNAARMALFVRSRVGVAVRAGATKPDISTPDAFKAALLAVRSVGISKGPSGVHMMGVLQRLGIAEQVRAKAVITEFGQRVGVQIANGNAEIGMQQITELLATPGIDVIGPLPAALQADIVYAIAPMTGAPVSPAADRLVAYLTSPAIVPVVARMGLEPG
jgi:molybdate transport system substrate-binding protein